MRRGMNSGGGRIRLLDGGSARADVPAALMVCCGRRGCRGSARPRAAMLGVSSGADCESFNSLNL